VIDGGLGVGKVTKPGLDQPVGNAAINSVPRRMIHEEVARVCEEYNYTGGISVVISAPDGEALAARTFNARLGITGGISILGTRGIVEPMSNSAIVGAIRAELQVLAASGKKNLHIIIGNYAEQFLRDVLFLSAENCIKCGNFIGETLGLATELGFKNILIVGHIGKLVKLGIGLTNTHSARGDGRLETLIACALRAGAPVDVLRGIDDCVATEAAVGLLRESGFLPQTAEILGARIDDTLKRQVSSEMQVGFICFSDNEILTESKNARILMGTLRFEE
jgi:cobalt-precorrin-5B (C1)-methyltransferase